MADNPINMFDPWGASEKSGGKSRGKDGGSSTSSNPSNSSSPSGGKSGGKSGSSSGGKSGCGYKLGEFDETDQLFFDQIESELVNDEQLQTQAKVNKIDTFKFAFEDQAIDKMVERMSQNEEIFNRITGDVDFKNFIFGQMLKSVYQRINNMGV